MVIDAGCVVTKDVPPCSMVVGESQRYNLLNGKCGKIISEI